jgi:hypothetical protein
MNARAGASSRITRTRFVLFSRPPVVGFPKPSNVCGRLLASVRLTSSSAATGLLLTVTVGALAAMTSETASSGLGRRVQKRFGFFGVL